MTDFAEIKGIGDQSFNNIFEFANSEEPIITYNEQNPELTF